MLKEQPLRFVLKPRGNSEKQFLGMLQKVFFDEKNFIFRTNKIGKCNKEERRNQKGEEKLKGFHRKR